MKINKLKLLALATGLAGLGYLAHAAAPLAGTPIGNQAKATYTDDSGVTRESFSNTVITNVAQVAGLTLVTDNQQKLATPGSQVYFPHTITNTGNGSDTYALATAQLTGDDFNLTVPGASFVYADANQDGLPDNWTPITSTGPLAPGAEFHVVVIGVVPPTATTGQTAQVSITATSQHTGTLFAVNTDTVTVTNGAVLSVTKTINTSTGLPGSGPFTYTLTYTNTGNAAATNFTLRDTIPAHLVYVAGSARWSLLGSGATALTDANDPTQGAAPNQIAYRYENGAGSNTLEAVVTSVAPGQSATLTFQVNVRPRTYFVNNESAPGVPAPIVLPATATNVATYGFTENGNPTTSFPYTTNPVPFQIQQDTGVTFTGPAPVASAAAGSTVVFNNTLTNTGSGIDTFDITVDTTLLGTAGKFPSGTTFQLFQSDGQTPLVDSNGNTTPDTGPLAPGATYVVVLKAILPTNASATSPVSVQKTATSTVNTATKATATDTLNAITGASVDLTNTSPRTGDPDPANQAPGEGAGPEAAAVLSNNVNPGSTTSFTLVVNNTGPFADSFNLSAGINNTATGGLPAGWTVVYKKSGVAVTNTGSIPAGGNTTIIAEVTVPAGFAAGARSIYFKVLSPINAVSDIIHDEVVVNVVRGLSLQTDNVGQTFPGGSVVYEHILKNNSNVVEGNNVGSVISFPALSDSLGNIGFTSVLYYDANNDGILDAADPVITTDLHGIAGLGGGLGLGQQVRVFVKVFAPLGAPDNASNATTLTVNVANGTHTAPIVATLSNLDTTSVTRGDLTVEKKQALDVNTDGTADAPGFVSSQLTALPGTRILYEITVTNTGSSNATSIVVNDTAPANTTYDGTFTPTLTYVANTGITATAPVGTVTQAGGVVVGNVGTLIPGARAIITFAVTINN